MITEKLKMSHRAAVQAKGFKRVVAIAAGAEQVVRAQFFGSIDAEDKCRDKLFYEVATTSYRLGIETEADALQPEMAAMSLRIAELESEVETLREILRCTLIF